MAFRNIFVESPATVSVRREQLVIRTERETVVPLEDVNALLIESRQSTLTAAALSALAVNNWPERVMAGEWVLLVAAEEMLGGFGKLLLDYSLAAAADMGFGAVLFEGNIGFYGKSGFDYAKQFGIRYHDMPEDADQSFFLCRELIPGYLDGITGVYQTPAGYYVDDADVEEFDRGFPPKEKLRLPGQIF